MKRIIQFTIIIQLSLFAQGQIIADHTVVDLYDDIPQQWIDSVKTMHFIAAGESHSNAYLEGLLDLEVSDSKFQVDVDGVDAPAPYTDTRLRADRVTWGDYDNPTGWMHLYGEEDWFTNSTAIERTKTGISYMHENGYTMSAFGLVWCWDMLGDMTAAVDPEYGFHWFGATLEGPEGPRPWGLSADDYAITGNSVSMDTYLEVTMEYIQYCTDNNIPTDIFFATGPLDTGTDEAKYQVYIKHEYIRDFVKADPSLILFDYADILCYDNDGSVSTMVWNGNTFPVGTPTNMLPEQVGHISDAGALRLAKAIWWMLARIAGWDGTIDGEDTTAPSAPSGLHASSASESAVSLAWEAASDNVGVTAYNIYLDGSLLGSTSELTYTDNTPSACGSYIYAVSAVDAAGNESVLTSDLLVANCTPDVTPTLIVTPNISHGLTEFEVIVRVTELNMVSTTGNILINIPADSRWSLNGSFDQSLAILDGIELNNSDWNYSSDAINHTFTSSTPIPAGGFSTFGFRITFNPDVSRGLYTITSQIVSGGGGEVRESNNVDSERLDYFQ